jgi:hypothetical protein
LIAIGNHVDEILAGRLGQIQVEGVQPLLVGSCRGVDPEQLDQLGVLVRLHLVIGWCRSLDLAAGANGDCRRYRQGDKSVPSGGMEHGDLQ